MPDDAPPTRHLIRAALHVARVVGERAHVDDAAESYWHRATGGMYPPSDLAAGEALLLDLGLLTKQDDVLTPAPELVELLQGEPEDAAAVIGAWSAVRITDHEGAERSVRALGLDDERREQLLLDLGRRFDDAERRRVGEIGEELVVAVAREELRALGRADLARAVRRVSLVSDQLGYDISAPRIAGPTRQLEVKATVVELPAHIFLSRGEARAAARLPDWALVVCVVDDVARRNGRVLGWSNFERLEPRLPRDVEGGTWEQARLEIAPDMLYSGLPGAAA